MTSIRPATSAARRIAVATAAAAAPHTSPCARRSYSSIPRAASSRSSSAHNLQSRNSSTTFSSVRALSQSTSRPATGQVSSSSIDQGAVGAEGLTAAPEHLNDKEGEIWMLLNRRLRPVRLEVQDISGGCGSMYGIEIVSEAFRGLSMLKQQRLVNEILGDDIKQWHGVQLKTRVP
ncbi:MAG: hypothetical protein M1818_007179 [Claussenomyces sp. TS43310]|nr:MAG: hypothetical protein M1818_007179 [Claussenomyces sp. TS43310]